MKGDASAADYDQLVNFLYPHGKRMCYPGDIFYKCGACSGLP